MVSNNWMDTFHVYALHALVLHAYYLVVYSGLFRAIAIHFSQFDNNFNWVETCDSLHFMHILGPLFDWSYTEVVVVIVMIEICDYI